mmetsp:Transcript_18688/g.27532  ORF Transcript_18688/g.27532 Transcript_18688/m.27532 type:complete len:220 (+) Transcript_18688:3-662(+)
MWNICSVDGFQHYQNWQKCDMDSYDGPNDAISDIGKDEIGELVNLAEHEVSNNPPSSLNWNEEERVVHYFALICLYIKSDLFHKAESILKQLIQLHLDTAADQPLHHDNLFLHILLEKALRGQGKVTEADKVVKYLQQFGEKEEESAPSLWNSLTSPSSALDMIIDPNKRRREEEEKFNYEVRKSKDYWLQIRNTRFVCLKAVEPSSCPAMYHVSDSSY